MAKKFTRKGRKTRSAGRFGVRYGTKVRKLVADIEERMRQGYKCPECGIKAIHRTDTGIWSCKKCNHTFSGGTYIPKTSVGLVATRSLKKAMETNVSDQYEDLVPEALASEDVTNETDVSTDDLIPEIESDSDIT
jgi:large subunit ribosomal protein L37Ae